MVLPANALSVSHKHIVKTCDFSPIRDIWPVDNEGFCASLIDSQKAPMEIAQDPSEKIMISKINWLSDTVLLAGCGDGKWFASGILVRPTFPRLQRIPSRLLMVLKSETWK
jgi:hypothetical protein